MTKSLTLEEFTKISLSDFFDDDSLNENEIEELVHNLLSNDLTEYNLDLLEEISFDYRRYLRSKIV
jgi:hypothetical protein